MSNTASSPDVFVHESVYVDENVRIGSGSKIWHYSHILKNVTIGEDCVFGQNTMIGPNVDIGNRCKIQNNVSVFEGVRLEDGVFCGPSCVFTNVTSPRAEFEKKNEFKETIVKKGASIGANATIVCGNELGRYCLIAAGAVIVSDVKDFALMAGVPAKRIGWVGYSGEKLDSDLICPVLGTRFYETPSGLMEHIE